jgi:type I restriction enzyme M protein
LRAARWVEIDLDAAVWEIPAGREVAQAASRSTRSAQSRSLRSLGSSHDNTLARPLGSWGKNERVNIVLTNPPFGGREEDGIENNFPTFRTKETADLFLALIVRLLKDGGRAAVALPDGTLFGGGVKTRLKEHLMEECDLRTIVRLQNSVFRPYASIGANPLFFEKGSPTQQVWFYEHRVPEGQKAYWMTRPIRVEHMQPCVDWWGGAKREGRQETPHACKMSADEIKARGYNLDIKNPHAVDDDHGDPETLLGLPGHQSPPRPACRL